MEKRLQNLDLKLKLIIITWFDRQVCDVETENDNDHNNIHDKNHIQLKAHQVFCIDKVAVLRPSRPIWHLIQAAQVGPGDDGRPILSVPDIEARTVDGVRQVEHVSLAGIVRVCD